MKAKQTWGMIAAVLMIFAMGFSAEARSFGPGFGSGGMGGGLGGLKALLELKLSDSQQAQMMNILTTYQDQREGLRNDMGEARKNLLRVTGLTPFNEEEARKAFEGTSRIREEMFVLKAKMRSELKAVLTPEQLELVKERKIQSLEKIRHRLDAWPENPR